MDSLTYQTLTFPNITEVEKFVENHTKRSKTPYNFGYKLVHFDLYIASNCVLDSEYNDDNYNQYFAIFNLNVFKTKYVPHIIESIDLGKIGNDNFICRFTDNSKVIKIKLEDDFYYKMMMGYLP